MASPPSPENQPLEAFEEQYWQDREQGSVRKLREYLTRFPGNDTAIAARFLENEAPPPPESESDSIGPYRIESELGRGGQGVVYKATDLRVGRTVALKVLLEMRSTSPEVILRFRREATVASRLKDPGICTVYETGQDDGIPYIAMEYVDGPNLAQMLTTQRDGVGDDEPSTLVIYPESENALNESEEPPRSSESHRAPERREILRVVAFFEKAARSLHAAHEAGVIHRDIKPGNIMVTTKRDPVIMDFGLARSDDPDLQALTHKGQEMGTVPYMSPEQILAQRVELDRRTDVWSLGVSLYECLTLRRPFQAPTKAGLYQAIQTKDPRDPTRLNPKVDTNLRAVVLTALEKDRDRRYQTALDLAEDLRRFREVKPIHAKPITPWVRFQRWVQRNPGVAGSLLAAFVILVAGTAVSTIQALRANAEAERATDNAGKAKEATAEANVKATEARQNAEAAEANLQQWRRMADVRLLKDLERDADEALWPPWPEKLPAMTRWLETAKELDGRLSDHESVLESLRRSAYDLTDDERRRDRETHSRYSELVELREQKDALTQAIAKLDGEIGKLLPLVSFLKKSKEREIAKKREEADALSARIARLDAAVSARRTWNFADERARYQHDVYTDLVEGTRALIADDGLVSDVRKRRDFAGTLRQRSIQGERSAWNDAIDNVARDPRFEGCRLTPQMGLVPLGPDPDSKLEEFGLLDQTGPLPVRDTATKKLILTDTSGVVLVLIPGGPVTIGSNGNPTKPYYDPKSRKDEQPPRGITLAPFFLSKYEMTQGQWERLTGENPATWQPNTHRRITPLHPVEQISWHDCERVLPRAGLRLPTEAQWESACRAGSTRMFWCGGDARSIHEARAGNIADLTASRRSVWTCTEEVEDGHVLHAPVGTFSANPFGLHDVLGNVWEWCRDGYGGYDRAAEGPDGLRRVPGARERAYRGGSYGDPADVARSATRYHYAPDTRDAFLGVRPARKHYP